jgi:hypothetical protein
MNHYELMEACEPFVKASLMNALELEIKWCEDRDDVDRIEAYKLVLKDFMLNDEYNQYINSI